MTDGHLNHLIASLAAMEDAFRRIEALAVAGRSPASGQAAPPLAAERWRSLDAPLRQMVQRLREAVARYAPERLDERDRMGGESVTLQWISVLLGRLQDDIVDDLAPNRLESRFGPLTTEDRAFFGVLHAALAESASDAQWQVDGCHGPGDGGRRWE